mmetsp:Transcript_3415/g.8462  ORF Transcript_3415/g.8462 Transcript_3415/m.8462 type:complete len:497 (-) Transcript_3415:212-1702(-)
MATACCPLPAAHCCPPPHCPLPAACPLDTEGGSAGGLRAEAAAAARSDLAAVEGEEEGDAAEHMVFLRSKPRLPLLSVGTDGCISVWDVFAGVCSMRLPSGHDAHEPLIGIATDEKNEILVTADAGGWVKVWEIQKSAWAKFCDSSSTLGGEGGGGTPGAPSRVSSAGPVGRESRRGSRELRGAASHDKLLAQGASPVVSSLSVNESTLPAVASEAERDRCLLLLHWWRVHIGGLVSIELVGKRSLLLSASADGFVSLWSFKGELVGTFGQGARWATRDKSTWRSLVPVSADGSAWREGAVSKLMRGNYAVELMAKSAAQTRKSSHAPTTAETVIEVRGAMQAAEAHIAGYMQKVVRSAASKPLERTERRAAMRDKSAAPRSDWTKDAIPTQAPEQSRQTRDELWLGKQAEQQANDRSRADARFADRSSVWEAHLKSLNSSATLNSSANFPSFDARTPNQGPMPARRIGGDAQGGFGGDAQGTRGRVHSVSFPHGS